MSTPMSSSVAATNTTTTMTSVNAPPQTSTLDEHTYTTDRNVSSQTLTEAVAAALFQVHALNQIPAQNQNPNGDSPTTTISTNLNTGARVTRQPSDDNLLNLQQGGNSPNHT